jgi:hypothetical protein
MNAAWHAWSRWQHAAGPWQGWTQCPPLLSPCVSAVDGEPAADRARATELAFELEPTLRQAGTLILLELEPTLGVQVAAELSAQRLAHPVLVLPRWPYADAVLPTQQLTEALVHEANRLPGDVSRLDNVVFVVDGERNRVLHARPPDDPRADNRHTLSIFDLPNLATLRARAIRRIVRVAHTPA